MKINAGYKCEMCLGERSDGYWLESAHIIGRTYRATRWGIQLNGNYDLNGICLCSGCHRAYDEHRPEELRIRRLVIGDERYEELAQTKKIIAKHQDYQAIREKLLFLKNSNQKEMK